MARILITNGGTHSPEKWAMCTAEMIFPLEDAGLVGERLIAAQKLQTTLAEILSGHHGSVIENERTKLADDADHFHTAHDASDYLDQVMAEIAAATKGCPWEHHFAQAAVKGAVREIIENHMHTVQHVERLHHAAHNKSEQGDHYFSKYH